VLANAGDGLQQGVVAGGKLFGELVEFGFQSADLFIKMANERELVGEGELIDRIGFGGLELVAPRLAIVAGGAGEGGAVVTNNPAYAQHLRVLRDWGAERKYEHLYKGFNYRMDGVQGAVLGVKLRYLEGWTERRRAIASQYDRLFAGSGITTPWADPLNRHVYHIYAIQVDDRPTVQAALQARGIATGIHYPIPVHLQPAYRTPQFPAGSLPHTEAAAQRVLSLPMFAELTDEQVATVVAAVRAVV